MPEVELWSNDVRGCCVHFPLRKNPSPSLSRVRNWVACVFRSLCGEGQGHLAQPMMGCTKWKPSTGDGEIEFKKKVKGAVWAENKDSLVAFQKNIEEAATSFSHTTKSTLLCKKMATAIEEQEKRIMKYKKVVRNILQKKGVCLKSPLSWYFRQGPRWPTTKSTDQKTPL